MILTFILVIVAFLALIFLFRLAQGHGAFPLATSPAKLQLRPVDLEAFRNLMDPEEQEFLRANLPQAEFRKVHRERMKAALDYILCAAHNASVLVRVGDAARQSSNPSIAEAGNRIVQSAIQLRLYALQAAARIWIGILLPGSRLGPADLVENYERVTRMVFLLGRMQRSPEEARISA